MTWSIAGGLAGLGLASGVLLVAAHVQARRRPDFAGRVLRHLSDLPEFGGGRIPVAAPVSRRILAVLAAWIGDVLGGATSVRRRLERADLPLSVAEFRVQQAIWGLVALCSFGALSVLVALRSPSRAVPMVVLTLLAAAMGVLLRENRLTAQVRAHEREVLAEIAQGKSNSAIADSLFLTKRAVEKHINSIFAKLGLTEEESVSRRVKATLTYLAEEPERTP